MLKKKPFLKAYIDVIFVICNSHQTSLVQLFTQPMQGKDFFTDSVIYLGEKKIKDWRLN